MFSSDKVFVYFNIRQKVFSIKAMQGSHKGLVISHSTSIVIKNAMFKVSEKGRLRVLAERRKNVHAGVVGEITKQKPLVALVQLDNAKRVTYNPYKFGYFYDKLTGEKIEHAATVILSVDQGIPSIFVGN